MSSGEGAVVDGKGAMGLDTDNVEDGDKRQRLVPCFTCDAYFKYRIKDSSSFREKTKRSRFFDAVHYER